jgi:addiction module RelE/StbE family toxin
MKNIILHKHFEKSYSKCSKKIKDTFKERKNLFIEDGNHYLLDIHVLHGKYKGYKSFNISGNIRVIYKEIEKDVFVFVDIGTHSKLYS